jgi:hypothetical protein
LSCCSEVSHGFSAADSSRPSYLRIVCPVMNLSLCRLRLRCSAHSCIPIVILGRWRHSPSCNWFGSVCGSPYRQKLSLVMWWVFSGTRWLLSMARLPGGLERRSTSYQCFQTYATAGFPEIERDPLALGCGNRGPWFLGCY